MKKTNKIINYTFLLVGFLTFYCSPDLSDYWAYFDKMDSGINNNENINDDNVMDTDSHSYNNNDAGSDVDAGSDAECDDDSSSNCGDGGDERDAWVWDGGNPDTDSTSGDSGTEQSFCETSFYLDFLEAAAYNFDNTTVPYLGNGSSPDVIITGFSYFLCVHCKKAAFLLNEMFEDSEVESKVAFYYRNYAFGTTVDSFGWRNHRAAQSSYKQGCFWEMHNYLYSNYPVQDEDAIFAKASEMGLDMDQFNSDYNSTEVSDYIFEDKIYAESFGVSATPTLFVNGVKISPWVNIPFVVECLLSENNK